MATRSSSAARRLSSEVDPVWQAILAAPIDDEPETEQERLAIAEAMRTGVRIERAVAPMETAARTLRGG